MEFLRCADLCDVDLTVAQAIACAFLEGAGLKCLVDFGFENAIEKARQVVAARDAGTLALDGVMRSFGVINQATVGEDGWRPVIWHNVPV